MAPRYELAVGLHKGHRTTKIRVARNKQDKKHTIRPSRLKGVSYKILYNVFCYPRERYWEVYVEYTIRNLCTDWGWRVVKINV
jgi:Ribosomal protein L36e.